MRAGLQACIGPTRLTWSLQVSIHFVTGAKQLVRSVGAGTDGLVDSWIWEPVLCAWMVASVG